MRASTVKRRLAAGAPVRIAMLGHFLPPFVAYAAAARFDAVWLEMEHRPLAPREVQTALLLCHHYDIDCLVRPPTRERAQLYRLLEDGATGLIMPHVPDAAVARDLVAATKFPPLGDRGLEGNSLESNFGLDLDGDRGRLVAHALAETLLCVQIETPQALAHCAAIAAEPGVDMLYFGPSDMGLRLQQDPGGPTNDEALATVARIAREHGKPWGCMPRTLEDVRRHAEMGAQLFVWGIDIRLLRAGLEGAAAELDSVF